MRRFNALYLALLDKTPELVPSDAGGAIHERLSRALRGADARGVSGPVDRLQFLVLALACGENFHRRPELADTWKAIREDGKTLQALMASWTQAQWEAVEGCEGRS